MKKLAVFAVLLMTGCAPGQEGYAGDQARISEALATCREKADAIPATTNAATNPFASAAMQQQYINDCMAAKGFPAR